VAGLLNLTDAEESGFDALPAGTYLCELFSHEMAETKGREGSALPAGTPMLKMQFKVVSNDDGNTEIEDDGKTISLENRRLFGQWVIAPQEINGEPYKHYKMMNGQLVSLFKALGYEEETIRAKKGFDPNFEDDYGKQVLVTVGRDTDYNSNPVKKVKPVGEGVGAGALL